MAGTGVMNRHGKVQICPKHLRVSCPMDSASQSDDLSGAELQKMLNGMTSEMSQLKGGCKSLQFHLKSVLCFQHRTLRKVTALAADQNKMMGKQ